MFKHKTYNSYKDSGIPWIGQIPTHWEVEQVKKAFTRKKAYCNTENPVILSLTHQGIKFRDISTNEGQIAASYFKYNPVAKGDILLNPMDLITNAFSAVSDKEGVISPAYVNLRTKEGYFNKYYDYYFKLQYWGLSFFAHGKGVSFENRWTLNNETLMNYFIPVPKYSEQQAIADYLDDKCAKIDKIIETEKAVIEKLKEYKQSLITETITKGLNPSAPMKDSGIPWIGKIPAHWEVKKTKYIGYSFVKGSGITKDDIYFDGDTKCIRYGEIYSKYDRECIEADSATNLSSISSPRNIYKGDILFACTGELIEEIGKNIVYMGDSPCLAGGDIIVLKHHQNPIFLNYALNNYYSQAQKSYGKIKLKVVHISVGNIGNIILALPPKNEQQAIANYLDDKCAKIEKSISDKEQVIEKLTKYKKSLIYECITGKRKVF